MIDFLGKEIEVDDELVFTSYDVGSMSRGKVVKVGEKQVTIYNGYRNVVKFASHYLIKVEGS